jgi:hypothetical protein
MNQRVASTPALTGRELRDLEILGLFTSVYCEGHHPGAKTILADHELERSGLPLHRFLLCRDCADFLAYACQRRLRCPLKEKPACKHCEVHCFRPGHRERVREVMRFSGRRLIGRGRLDLLWHYLF